MPLSTVAGSMEVEPTRARAAFAQRVRAVGAVLLDDPPDPGQGAAAVLWDLARSLVARPTDERVWLALAGIAASFPTRDEVERARRRIELSDPEQAAIFLLNTCMSEVRDSGAPLATVRIETGRVLVDVDFTARHDLHTGIQRVIRQTMPFWHGDRNVEPVAWTSSRGAMRPLDPAELTRIVSWSPERRTDGGTDDPDLVSAQDDHVVLPWRCVVMLPEVPLLDIAPRLAAIGANSNNRLVAIGYDAIPLLSADTVDLDEPKKFMAYLSVIKFADRIAAISRSSTAEFASFGSMLTSQGLPSPTCLEVALPVDTPNTAGSAVEGTGSRPPAPATVPEVVVVGSHDVRKNHLAILHAAELIWQRGIEFRLSFIGSGGSNQGFLRRLKVLRHRGRDVRIRSGLSDAELQQAVAAARFTVFPSLHEGYGLPVAESLALGTPVITTSYGSTAEIAEGGGAVTVDPRDDAELTSAMERLLVDDAAIAGLRAEISNRRERTWQHYADELWDALVRPVLHDLARTGDAEGRAGVERGEHSPQ